MLLFIWMINKAYVLRKELGGGVIMRTIWPTRVTVGPFKRKIMPNARHMERSHVQCSLLLDDHFKEEQTERRIGKTFPFKRKEQR